MTSLPFQHIYLHLALVEEFLSSINPENYADGSIATSRVSQARQIKRVGGEGTRIQIPVVPEAAISVTT